MTLFLTVRAIDPQPLRRCPLRRCSRLRDWFCHHLQRCPDCLLGQEDRPFTPRQANCQGAFIRRQHQVGSRQQAHVYRCKFWPPMDTLHWPPMDTLHWFIVLHFGRLFCHVHASLRTIFLVLFFCVAYMVACMHSLFVSCPCLAWSFCRSADS